MYVYIYFCMWSPSSLYKADRTCLWFTTSVNEQGTDWKTRCLFMYIYIHKHKHVCYACAQICACKSPWLVIPRIKVIRWILPYRFAVVTNVSRYFTVYVLQVFRMSFVLFNLKIILLFATYRICSLSFLVCWI